MSESAKGDGASDDLVFAAAMVVVSLVVFVAVWWSERAHRT
jgi:hypothetical protein